MNYYEKLPITIDIEKLRIWLHEIVKLIGEPVYTPRTDHHTESQYKYWSILSENGHWDQKYVSISPYMRNNKFDEKTAIQMGWKAINLWNKPTEIHISYMNEVMQMLSNQGLEIKRARCAMLLPESASVVHRDGIDGIHNIRLHIPLMTNLECKHVIVDTNNHEIIIEEIHMPADGSIYAVKVDNSHRIVNAMSDPRYHIVMDVSNYPIF